MTTVPSHTQRHTHASGLHAVATALDDLHRDLIRATGAESSQVRLSVLNILAACNDASFIESTTSTVLEVAQRHPARVIVIMADRRGDPVIESDIALRHADDGSHIELIRLEVRGEPARHLASIVQPLLVPDIPVQLWLVGAPPLEQAFAADAVSVCDRVILDTATYPDAAETLRLIAAELERHGDTLTLNDLAWERLQPWRSAVAHAFEGATVRPWMHRVTGVDIVSSGRRSAMEGWLLAGWLSSRLGWRDTVSPEIAVSCVPHPSPLGPELLRLRLRCQEGKHRARIHVERRAHVLHTSIDIDAGVVASGATALPQWSDAMLVGRLMSEIDDDPVFRGAVSEAARLAAAS
ncbi:MAG: glucose-6-phosphate dehydrogenase assembly protein OpcA [Candidatus Dormibacteraeota bacterium]|nr:glucose-6-phosphate dehydrogenase assembly protein OpcA [Candidatus Dormibacteraeota bacterium]